MSSAAAAADDKPASVERIITSSQLLSVPELRTEPPSPTDAEGEADQALAHDLSHQTSSNTIRQHPSMSNALVTDTESEGGYASTYSNANLEVDPGRLSVFSRRAASKSSSETERRTMTVETEVVPNVCTNSSIKIDHHARSLKGKASNDTVRASQKPKKKKSRIAVVNANHIPTKSEIYAATITQAVDEVEDSDSDETFVYESNPKSPKRLSRTPSLVSVRSSIAGERHVSLSRADGPARYSQGLHHYDDRDREKLQRTHAISGKRSMKFANNPYDEGTQRRHVSHTLSTQHRNVLGDDGPFTRSPRLRPGLERRTTSPSSSTPVSPKILRPASPRVPQRYGMTPAKRERKGNPTSFRPWSLYEDEEEGGSSSERSPFLRRKSSRTYRTTRDQRSESRLMTGMPFIIVIFCLMLVICMMTAAALSTSQPLRNVKVVNVTNVLVSKQELLFDLVVEAYNPNILAITVKDVELSIFAQSVYVRSSRPLLCKDHTTGPACEDLALADTELAQLNKPRNEQYKKQTSTSSTNFWPPWSPSPQPTKGYPEDEETTTLLLGRVHFLDSNLIFESKFFNRSVSTAAAELRVVKPGHVTDEGGVEIWERVIQHSFELIVRGVMKYSTSSFSKTVRTAELYRTAHINPAKIEFDSDVLETKTV